jgi:hypothetical protein
MGAISFFETQRHRGTEAQSPGARKEELVLFVLVLVLSETVLVLEEMYRDCVYKRAKY